VVVTNHIIIIQWLPGTLSTEYGMGKLYLSSKIVRYNRSTLRGRHKPYNNYTMVARYSMFIIWYGETIFALEDGVVQPFDVPWL
jgi:hypothetical protein